MRVLVCDDDAAVMVMLEVALDSVEVVEAYRLADATVAAAGGGLDAAVVDRRLPDGDGLALVRALRHSATNADLPIVVLTTDHRPGDLETIFAAGADEQIVKPFEPLQLADLLRRLSLLTPGERQVRRTVRRARARAGRPSPGWDDLPGGGAPPADVADAAAVVPSPRGWGRRRR